MSSISTPSVAKAYLARIGARGGRSRSERKLASSRENLAQARALRHTPALKALKERKP